MSQFGNPVITEAGVRYIRPTGIPTAEGVGTPVAPVQSSQNQIDYTQYDPVFDWTLRYPKTTSGTVFNNAGDVILTERVDNSESSIDFKIPATDPKRTSITTGEEIDIPLFPKKRWLVTWYEDQRAADGTLFTQVHGETYHYELRGYPIYDFDMVNVTATQVLTAALAGTGWSVGTVQAPQVRGFKVAQSNALAVVQQVQKDYGGELWYDEKTKTVNLTAGNGRNTSIEVSWTKNLAASTRRVDASTQVDVVIVEGENGIIAGDCSTSCHETLQSTLDVADLSTTVRVAYLSNRDLNSRAAAVNWASMQRLKLCRREVSYHVDYVDLSHLPGFSTELAFLGDVLTITDAELGVSTRQRVVQWVFNTLEPWKSSYDFTNKVPEFTSPQIVLHPIPRDAKEKADLIKEDQRLMGVWLGTSEKNKRTTPSFDPSSCIKSGFDASQRLVSAADYAVHLGSCLGLVGIFQQIHGTAQQILSYFSVLNAWNQCIQQVIRQGVWEDQTGANSLGIAMSTTVSTNSLDPVVSAASASTFIASGYTTGCGGASNDLATAITAFNSMVPQALTMRREVWALGQEVLSLMNQIESIQKSGSATDRELKAQVFEARRDGKLVPTALRQQVQVVSADKACFQVCRAVAREIQALNNTLQIQKTCITGGRKTEFGLTVSSDSGGSGNFGSESPQGGDGSVADDQLGDPVFGDLPPDDSTDTTDYSSPDTSSNDNVDTQTGSAGNNDDVNPGTEDPPTSPDNPDNGMPLTLPGGIAPESAMGQMYSRIQDMAQMLRGAGGGGSCFQECCDVVVTSFGGGKSNINSLGKTSVFVSTLGEAFGWVQGNAKEGTSVSICIESGHYSIADLSGLTGWSGNLTIVGVGVGD